MKEQQKVARCNTCGELFGTRTALEVHKPGKCRSEKTMKRAGAWRGFRGIWWTPDLGLDDATETLPISRSQVIEFKGRKLGQNGGGASLPLNGVLSKFAGVSS